MFTAKDMHEILKKNELKKEEIIDEWLKEKVAPNYSDNMGYACPDGVTLSEAEDLLGTRGFDVHTYSGYQGSFIYLKIPPQEE